MLVFLIGLTIVWYWLFHETYQTDPDGSWL